MRIEIMDGEDVLNVITASEDFAEAHYPGRWRLAAVQDQPQTPVYADVIEEKIEQMEREQMMPTATRLFILEAMEREAGKVGMSIETLTAKNKTYRMLKQFDDQIKALRAQL